MRSRSSALIATEGTTHSSSLFGYAWVDDAVAAYLSDGSLPARLEGNQPDVVCPALPLPEPMLANAAAKQASNWIMGALARVLKEKDVDIGGSPVTPERLAGLIAIVDRGAISGSMAKPRSRSRSERKRSVRIALWQVMTSEIQQL